MSDSSLRATPYAPLLNAPGSSSSAVETAPVRVISIRDVARLAAQRGMIERGPVGVRAAKKEVRHARFVARDPVDHPWLGRRETWYDYLDEDIDYWRRFLYVWLPLRWAFIISMTWALGLVLRHDGLLNTQMSAMGTPVSAFSLLTSLLLTFRHSVAYQRFWDAKGYVANFLASIHNVSTAFVNSPLEHRREIAAYLAALLDALCRALQLETPTAAEAFEKSPPGPWRQCALAALPDGARVRMAATPSNQVATLVGDICTGEPMQAIDGCLRGALIFELQAAAHQFASLSMLNRSPIPPIYSLLLLVMIHAFVCALTLLIAISLATFVSPVAWCAAACTVALIYTVFLCFQKAAHELAKPFQGKLQVPLRMYEAASLHNIYSLLQPITQADLDAAAAAAPGPILPAAPGGGAFEGVKLQ